MLKKFLALLDKDRNSFHSAESTQNQSLADSSASCFLERGLSFWIPRLFQPALFTGWGVSWWGGDARTSWHVTGWMLWLDGKENTEESILHYRYSVKEFILLYCLYLQRAPEYRAMYKPPIWRARAWGKAQSHHHPWRALLDSFLAWFVGSPDLMAQQLAPWPRNEGAV